MGINGASNGLDNIFDNEDISLSQGSSKSVQYETQENDENDTESKIFNDSIHGHIELHPLLVKFIDTPQFQRLRNIKQLGGNYFVFPGASHNRFEHSIGTCHLAGKLVKQLRQKQLSLRITNVDVLCVQIAGLCHDLGHGPFSHMFDYKFIPQLRPNIKWNHERGSCIMLDYLIQDNNLQPELDEYEITDQDIEFIKEMIAGPIYSTNANDVWRYKGRDQSKSFLYEIVSNERNKVDVDKWDYFARDCHHLGMKNGFDHNRFMHNMRVLTVEGQSPQICARDKEAMNVYELFHVRNRLHRSAYQHKCKTAVEEMICDAMVLANDFIKYRGKDGKEFSIAECIDDPVAFVKLTDHVFDQILHSNDMNPDMVKARHILERIQKRDLYKFVGKARPGKEPLSQSCLEIENKIASLSPSLSTEDISVNILKYDYGMKAKNPCDNFMFYSKNQPTKPYYIRKEEVSVMLPNTFQDRVIQVFCKDQDKLEFAKDCFEKWCADNENKMKSLPNDPVLTPLKRKSIGQSKSAKIPKLSKF